MHAQPCEGCAIVVLAAGRGSRMGLPKALMTVQGEPWWLHQHRRLSLLGGTMRWVVSDNVNTHIEQSRDCPSTMSRIRVDSAAPMFHSVLAGVLSLHAGQYARHSTLIEQLPDHADHSEGQATPSNGVFILPIDVPSPSADTWRSLRHDPSIPLPRVPICHGKRGHPVFLPAAWIASMLFPQLPDLSNWNPAAANPTVDSLLASLRLDTLIEPSRTLVPVDDSGILANLNTPADLDAWLHTSSSQAVE